MKPGDASEAETRLRNALRQVAAIAHYPRGVENADRADLQEDILAIRDAALGALGERDPMPEQQPRPGQRARVLVDGHGGAEVTLCVRCTLLAPGQTLGPWEALYACEHGMVAPAKRARTP